MAVSKSKKVVPIINLSSDNFKSPETETLTGDGDHKLNELSIGLENHDQILQSIKKQIEVEFPKKLKSAEEKLENDKVNIVEVIGAFVAFFTFISVEINIFRLPLSIWSLVGFSLLNLSMMTFFISTIQTILRSKLFSNFYDFFRSINFIFMLISIILMMASTTIIYIGQESNPKMIFLDKENDRNKYILLEDQSFLSTLIYKKIEDGDRATMKELEKLKQCLGSANYVYQIKSCILQ